MTQILSKKDRVFLSRLLLMLVSFLSVVILTSLGTPALSNAIPSLISLEEGKVVLQGTNGDYTGQVIVKGSLATIWAVLTDYDHYKDFMPNVIESHLIKSDKNKKIFEQVQIFKLVVTDIRGRVKLAVTENYPKEIKFKVIEGDVKSLEGFWQIEKLSPTSFLLTHRVLVEPKIKSDLNRNLFFTVYEDTLENTLKAVNEEVQKRFNGT